MRGLISDPSFSPLLLLLATVLALFVCSSEGISNGIPPGPDYEVIRRDVRPTPIANLEKRTTSTKKSTKSTKKSTSTKKTTAEATASAYNIHLNNQVPVKVSKRDLLEPTPDPLAKLRKKSIKPKEGEFGQEVRRSRKTAEEKRGVPGTYEVLPRAESADESETAKREVKRAPSSGDVASTKDDKRGVSWGYKVVPLDESIAEKRTS